MSDFNTSADRSGIIPGQYVVFFKAHCDQELHDTHINTFKHLCAARCMRSATSDEPAKQPDDFISVEFNVNETFRGYSGQFDDETLNEVKADPLVHSVEPDKYVYPLKVTQENVPSWGLARLSHQGPLGSDQASKNYVYDEETDGHGTTAYVIDTGIYVEHEDFEGRARWGTVIPKRGATKKDFDGHGTHVAGTIGGKTYGVAKKTNLVAVKIFPDGANQGGSMSDIIAGLGWAVQDANARGDIDKCVANMSVGGGRMESVNAAINAAVSAGLTVCVAAGNEGRDARNTSPASAESAITVGSLDQNDSISSFSNHGTVLDIFAPGRNIVSCSNKGPTQSIALSGTSMATPHVAGLACSILTNGKGKKPADVLTQMHTIAESQAVQGEIYGAKNKLLRQAQPAQPVQPVQPNPESPPPSTGDDETEEAKENESPYTCGSEPSTAK